MISQQREGDVCLILQSCFHPASVTGRSLLLSSCHLLLRTCPCQHTFDTAGSPGGSEAPAAAGRWVKAVGVEVLKSTSENSERGLPLSGVLSPCFLWSWIRRGWEGCSRDSWVQGLSFPGTGEAEHEDALQGYVCTWTLSWLLRRWFQRAA